ncbi:hypothetical protein CDAR_288201 [Caerostris darwini]|uniref:Uncharacterized protein n=1 Tax=Caerostris darwini TaxID=1538125 RepID=A0AAV4W999_9ARAC|nr:hypothetical protein CDAR_288201 [Caerostris darwini]
MEGDRGAPPKKWFPGPPLHNMVLQEAADNLEKMMDHNAMFMEILSNWKFPQSEPLDYSASSRSQEMNRKWQEFNILGCDKAPSSSSTRMTEKSNKEVKMTLKNPKPSGAAVKKLQPSNVASEEGKPFGKVIKNIEPSDGTVKKSNQAT